MTPPMAFCAHSSSPSSSCSDDDEEEAYFAKTYVPLSSLPTPPPSNDSTRQQSPEMCFSFSSEETLDPGLLGTSPSSLRPRVGKERIRLITFNPGPASHLANLIPSSTSLLTPSVPLVHALLSRAALPLETVALAVCILDSLTPRFALSWRTACPLSPPTFNPHLGPHIDAVQPELVVLAALILAVKFLDDAQVRTSEHAARWASGVWTCAQINVTQRVLLENLGYRLLPLWKADIIAEAVRDMARAGRQYAPAAAGCRASGLSGFGGLGGKAGEAVLGLRAQLTPVESPKCENVRGGDYSHVANRAGARDTCSQQQQQQLPSSAAVGWEPFPLLEFVN